MHTAFFFLVFALHFTLWHLLCLCFVIILLSLFLSFTSFSFLYVCFTDAQDTKSEFKCSLKPLFLFLVSHLFIGEGAFSHVKENCKILNYIQLQVFQAFILSVLIFLNLHSLLLSIETEHTCYALARCKITRKEQQQNYYLWNVYILQQAYVKGHKDIYLKNANTIYQKRCFFFFLNNISPPKVVEDS